MERCDCCKRIIRDKDWYKRIEITSEKSDDFEKEFEQLSESNYIVCNSCYKKVNRYFYRHLV